METKVRHRLVCVAWIVLTAAGIGRSDADAVAPRVRPLGRWMHTLLARGYGSSRTFAALVDALERSDVIVHIDERRLPEGGPVGETQCVAAAGGQRYLRINLDVRLREDMAVAILGHELQHAREIAEARWVVDQETLAALYCEIGHPSRHPTQSRAVDSIPARDVARRVLNELRLRVARASGSTF
jgi:hypothetical protein